MRGAARRFAAFYGSRPGHLMTMLTGFALLGYLLVTFRPAALWNPGAWWQSIAVWLAAVGIWRWGKVEARWETAAAQHRLQRGQLPDRAAAGLD